MGGKSGGGGKGPKPVTLPSFAKPPAAPISVLPVVLAAAYALKKLADGFAAAIGAAAGAVTAFTDALTKAVQNRYVAASSGFLKDIGSAMDSVSRYGMMGLKVPAAFAKAAGEVIESMGGLVEAFVQRGRDLAKFSPKLTITGARAFIREFQADRREAAGLGPRMADIMDLQSRIWVEIRDLLIPMKQALADVIVFMLRRLLELVKLIGASADLVSTIWGHIRRFSLVHLIKDLVVWGYEYIVGKEEYKKEEDMLDIFQKMIVEGHKQTIITVNPIGGNLGGVV